MIYKTIKTYKTQTAFPTNLVTTKCKTHLMSFLILPHSGCAKKIRRYKYRFLPDCSSQNRFSAFIHGCILLKSTETCRFREDEYLVRQASNAVVFVERNSLIQDQKRKLFYARLHQPCRFWFATKFAHRNWTCFTYLKLINKILLNRSDQSSSTSHRRTFLAQISSRVFNPLAQKPLTHVGQTLHTRRMNFNLFLFYAKGK